MRRRDNARRVAVGRSILPGLRQVTGMGFIMLPNGCSWYETHRLGGCERRVRPRTECVVQNQPISSSGASQEHRLALLVPYRSADRTVNILDFSELCSRLEHHLAQRGIDFHVFIINQVDSQPFNRGALVNAAVATIFGPHLRTHLQNARPFDYLAVHDIDRLPVLNNISGCGSAIASYYTYPLRAPRVLHPTSFAGGVLLTPLALFRAVNGFANSYWGWGEEDNDLFLRLRWCGLPPQHGERIDWCMEHRDCEACSKQKRLLDTSVLRAHERRVQRRLAHPRRYMLRDGLSTLNFSAPGRPKRLRCGPLRVTAIDVNLGGHHTSAADDEY